MDCRLETKALYFLLQDTSGLGTEIRLGRWGRKGLKLLEIRQVGSDLVYLLLLLVPQHPLFLD